MENIFDKAIKGALTGILLYFCWNVFPYLKQRFIKRYEGVLEKHGLFKLHKIIHKMIKVFLYIVLIIMVVIPVLFFLLVIISNFIKI